MNYAGFLVVYTSAATTAGVLNAGDTGFTCNLDQNTTSVAVTCRNLTIVTPGATGTFNFTWGTTLQVQRVTFNNETVSGNIMFGPNDWPVMWNSSSPLRSASNSYQGFVPTITTSATAQIKDYTAASNPLNTYDTTNQVYIQGATDCEAGFGYMRTVQASYSKVISSLTSMLALSMF